MPGILYLLLFTLSLIWGASFFFIKILLTDYSPFAIVFFRTLFGIIVILSIMLITRRKIIPKNAPWLKMIFVGLFNSAIPWILISSSEKLITSSMASILNATTPIWTLIVGVIVFKSKIRPMQWIGISLGFIGIFLLLNIDVTQLVVNNYFGFFGVILAAICYGISSQFIKRYLNDLNSFQIALSTLVTASIVSGTLTAITGSFHFDYLISRPHLLLSFIILGGFGSGVAYLIYYYIIQKGSAEFASLVTYLVPVTAIFWGVTLLGEDLRMNMLIGLLFIFSGVYISGRKKKEALQKRLVEKEIV